MREGVELDDFVALFESALKDLFELFHKQMRKTLKREASLEPNQALVYKKYLKSNA